MASVSQPPALSRVYYELQRYTEATAGEHQALLFDEKLVPYPKSTDEFWWAILLMTKPFRSVFNGDQPLISSADQNQSQTPKEEVKHIGEQTLQRHSLDAAYILDENAEPRMLDIIQVNPTSNFLDKSVYKHVRMEKWKFAEYAVKNLLCLHSSDVPMFLGYRMNVFGYGVSRCVELQHKVHLRNTPANLLTLDKKKLSAPVDIHGKVFVIAHNRQMTPAELQEIVIFCMGQAECSELKLTSWQKLKDSLQEEARKFSRSAQHLRAPDYA
eukprot:jgi/Ulvmu1/7257/UM035_0044.1